MTVCLCGGEFIVSQDYLEKVEQGYDFERHRTLVDRYNFDPKVAALAQGSQNYWMLGYPDRARRAADECLTLARWLDAPIAISQALSMGTLAYLYCGDFDTVEARLAQAVAFNAEHVVATFSNYAACWQAVVQVQAGDAQGGLESLRNGLATEEATGALLAIPYMHMQIAEALGRLGRPQEGLPLLAQALALVARGNMRRYEAEIYRVRGDLYGRCGTPDQAEADYRQALAIARHQQAKSWELRAATSLARLWQQQGKRQDAYELLAPVYNWFTEGFDTADLQEAKALLEVLVDDYGGIRVEGACKRPILYTSP
jgi:predicted ATPase